MTKKILFISYFAGVDANCPAEWADDRLRSLESLGERVAVLTNYGSKLIGGTNTIIIRTPSLSSDDFSHELNLRGGSKAINGVGKYFLFALVCIVGDLLKWLTKLLTRGGSGGKWSWLICTIPVGIWIGLFFRPHIIYCTGGPPSAYIVGLITSLVYRVPFKAEFQDPLVGKEIGKSKFKQKIVRIFERLILSRAELCVYVTKQAARDSQDRNQDLKNKIICNYPGSWDFGLSNHIDHKLRQKSGKVNILHMGTLYGSRNLDKFFIALDELYRAGNIERGDVMVTNLGSVYTNSVVEYLARNDFNLLPERQRIDALKIATSANYLLLVQHDDERSTETIPYKLYDYINLNIPIILLVKNNEIKDLCPNYSSLSASCSDIVQIKSAIYNAVSLHKTIQYHGLRNANSMQLSINTQVSNIIYRSANE